MTLEEVIVAECATIAPIYALFEPPGVTGECIVYQVISAPVLHVARYVQPRVQFTCRADSYGAAVLLADALWDFFEGRHVTVDGVHYRSMVINELDGPTDVDTSRYSRILDVLFSLRRP